MVYIYRKAEERKSAETNSDCQNWRNKEKGRIQQVGWTDEVEEVLKIIEIRNWHTVARCRKEWKRAVWTPSSTMDGNA
jgi:hypothetical protein